MITVNQPLNSDEQHLVALLNSLEEAVQRSLEASGYDSFNYWACQSNDLSRETIRCIRQVAAVRYQSSLRPASSLRDVKALGINS